MRINEKKSTSGMQSLQQDEAIWRQKERTCAYTKTGFGKIKPIPIKPL
jgi:hypothetical protein